MIRFEINTSGSSVGRYIKLLEHLNPLEDDRIIRAIIKRGVEILKEESRNAKYKFGSGQDIVEDMDGKVINNHSGVLFNNNPKMPYIEFGTGVVGRGTSSFNQSILDQAGWVYNEKKEGWWYPTKTQPPKGQPSFYDERKSQWYAWTRGQEAKNIFYNSTLRLQREMPQIITIVMGEKIKEEVRNV